MRLPLAPHSHQYLLRSTVGFFPFIGTTIVSHSACVFVSSPPHPMTDLIKHHFLIVCLLFHEWLLHIFYSLFSWIVFMIGRIFIYKLWIPNFFLLITGHENIFFFSFNMGYSKFDCKYMEKDIHVLGPEVWVSVPAAPHYQHCWITV